MEAQSLPIGTYSEPDLQWGEFLVECPNCRQCAQVKTRARSSQERYRLLTCTSCGLAQRYHTNSSGKPSTEIESCFEARFWLNTNCAGHTLWAANENHLQYLESHLTEEKNGRPLPDWMVVGKNRDEVMRGISKLRNKLDSLH